MEKGFTLTETIIIVVIILVLATLAIAGYRQVLDNAYQKVCATNQRVLTEGLKRHFLETGVVPATLGDIEPEYLDKAYIEVMKDTDWLTKLSYSFVKLNTPKEAHAQVEKLEDLVKWEKMRKYGVARQAFQCPGDHTAEGISYGINTNLRNYNSWEEIPSDEVIIGDCDNYTFSSEDELSPRHIQNFGTQTIAQSISKSREIRKIRMKKAKRKLQDEYIKMIEERRLLERERQLLEESQPRPLEEYQQFTPGEAEWLEQQQEPQGTLKHEHRRSIENLDYIIPQAPSPSPHH